MVKEDLIKLAFVAHPHGIKGEAEIRLINPDPEDSILEDKMKVWVFPSSLKSQVSKTGEEWIIQKIRFGNKIICEFEGIKDRTHLEKMIPFEIYLPREAFPEPGEDEIYLVDLIDMEVVDLHGDKLGTLESFSDNGMQYLFNVRLNSGEVLTLPYVDHFFPKVNTQTKKITMIMPEYSE